MLALLLALAAVLVPAAARAESWTVVCEEHFPPYNFIRDGERAGLDTEIVRAVFARMGVREDLQTYPWRRALGMLEAGSVDLLYQMVETPERRAKFLLVGPLRTGRTVLLARADSTIAWNSIEDLAPYSVGVVRGFSYTPAFDAAPLNKVQADDNAGVLRLLVNGRIDLAVGDALTLAWEARQAGIADRLKVVGAPLGEVPRYVALPRDRADKAERFRLALEAIRADGELDHLRKKWE